MGTEKKDSLSEPVDLEKLIKLIIAVSGGVGVVVYSYCLGYFRTFEIPDFPSFFEAVIFYISSALKILEAERFVGLELIFLRFCRLDNLQLFFQNEGCSQLQVQE